MNAPQQEGTTLVVSDLPLVLIATADRDLATYVRRCLVGHYRTLEAHDGETAVRRAAAAHPALILIDVTLPQPGGYALCRVLRAEADLRHIPVVLMTGATIGNAEEQTEAIGAAAKLRHPFNARRLLAALDTACISTEP